MDRLKVGLVTIMGALLFAALGYYAARLDIWFFGLGPTQAAWALWMCPAILGVAGGLYSFIRVSDPEAR